MWDQMNDALRESGSRAFTLVAGFLPGVLALVVCVSAALLLAWLAAGVARRLLLWLNFDRRFERLGITAVGDWAVTPTQLAARTAFWLVMLLGAIVGVAALATTVPPAVGDRLLDVAPRVVVASLLLLAGGVLARYLARGVLISAVNLQLPAARLISLGVKWLILVLAATMALNHLGIGGAILELAFGMLFGGIVLALALAVGLGSKDVVSRTWERQAERRAEKRASGTLETPVHHL